MHRTVPAILLNLLMANLLLVGTAEAQSLTNDAVTDSQRTTSIYLIGNSLTWDTVPSKLDGNVQWHVDCGKPLTYIRDNPAAPCVKTSTLWPAALSSHQYDYVSVQPHYGTTIEEDFDVISEWVRQQPKAVFVVHTGWAKHEHFDEEFSDKDAAGTLTHSDAYINELLKRLRVAFPAREFRCTHATNLLKSIADDIDANAAPISGLTELYRDAIHMTINGGRFLMHNAMRQTIGQPLKTDWPNIDPNLQTYLVKKLQESR